MRELTLTDLFDSTQIIDREALRWELDGKTQEYPVVTGVVYQSKGTKRPFLYVGEREVHRTSRERLLCGIVCLGFFLMGASTSAVMLLWLLVVIQR